MPSLSTRRRQPEIMDQPGLNPDEHDRALGGLARINFITRSARILWDPLLQLGKELRTDRLRILDVATGAGDVPVRLWQMADQAGIDWQIEGSDVSEVAVEHARRRAELARAPVNFHVDEAVGGPPISGYDAVVCSLFLHHLDEDKAIALLRRMAGLGGKGAQQPARLVLVHDIIRSLPSLALAHLGTRLFSASYVVHTDGPRSVEGAFTVEEVQALAERAGLHGATFTRHWPCRFLMAWRPA